MLRSVHAFLLPALLLGASPVLASPAAASFGALDRGDAWEAGSDGDHAPDVTPFAEVETEEEERDGEGSTVRIQPGSIDLEPSTDPGAHLASDLLRAPPHEPSFRVSPSRGPPPRR